MKISDLAEAASAIVYHYTSIADAKKIVDSGVFELSISTGTRSEEDLAPKGYPYFFSTTRTKLGDYHRYVGTGAAMFVIDGNWLNQRYKAQPVDYWERLWLASSGRTRESEDRIFSREPTIPITPVLELHVLLKTQDEYRSPAARQLLIASRRQGIATYFYTDEAAWRLLNKSKATPITRDTAELKGPEIKRSSRMPLSSGLKPWLELIYKKDKSELSKNAERLRYNILWHRYDKTSDYNLGIDVSNARKPGNDDRAAAIKILNYMREKNYSSFIDLVNAVHQKWDKKHEASN